MWKQLCYCVGNKSSLGGEFYENGEFATYLPPVRLRIYKICVKILYFIRYITFSQIGKGRKRKDKEQYRQV